MVEVEADIVVTATRTTNSCPHIIKCTRALEQGKNYSSGEMLRIGHAKIHTKIQI